MERTVVREKWVDAARGIVFFFWVQNYLRISGSYSYLVRSSYVLLVSVGLTALAYAVGRLLQKNTVTSRLFLGR